MEWNEGQYKISNDKKLLSIEKISGLLSTRDSHKYYKKFGFIKDKDTFMYRIS